MMMAVKRMGLGKKWMAGEHILAHSVCAETGYSIVIDLTRTEALKEKCIKAKNREEYISAHYDYTKQKEIEEMAVNHVIYCDYWGDTDIAFARKGFKSSREKYRRCVADDDWWRAHLDDRGEKFKSKHSHDEQWYSYRKQYSTEIHQVMTHYNNFLKFAKAFKKAMRDGDKPEALKQLSILQEFTTEYCDTWLDTVLGGHLKQMEEDKDYRVSVENKKEEGYRLTQHIADYYKSASV